MKHGFPNLANSRFRSLMAWIQAIKLRKREFNRLEKIQQFYQLTSCLSKTQRKNEVTIVFDFFKSQKRSFFQKHSKSARQTHFLQKMTKIFYLTELVLIRRSENSILVKKTRLCLFERIFKIFSKFQKSETSNLLQLNFSGYHKHHTDHICS